MEQGISKPSPFFPYRPMTGERNSGVLIPAEKRKAIFRPGKNLVAKNRGL
jgi:hypothetical protein